jgi:hypothetical protein
MRSELHWTGAALLLAIAIPGSKSTRPRRGAALNPADDARRRACEEGASGAANPGAGRQEQSPQRVVYRAETTCLHCGWSAGELEWNATAPAGRVLLRRATGEVSRPVLRGGRLCCARCGGPLFAERPKRVLDPSSINLGTTSRGRPRKPTTLQAS